MAALGKCSGESERVGCAVVGFRVAAVLAVQVAVVGVVPAVVGFVVAGVVVAVAAVVIVVVVVVDSGGMC